MKYFQKLKCKHEVESLKDLCPSCKGSGIIAGADITSTIKPILDNLKIKAFVRDNKKGYGFRIVYKNKIISNNCAHDYAEEIVKNFNLALEQAKQIIEENVILSKAQSPLGEVKVEE